MSEQQIACPWDGILFTPKKEWQKFCTPQCKQKAANQRRKEAMQALKEKERNESSN